MTSCDLIETKLAQILWKMVALCSACNSITSLMNNMVSRLGNVYFPSNFKKLFINGASTVGIVSGYCWVIELMDLIRRFR